MPRKAKSKKKKPVKLKPLRERADRLWSSIVRSIGYCERCGATQQLEAHHLIRREHLTYRYDVYNGICLCTNCHKFGNEAAHAGTAGPSCFLDWLKEHKPATFEWLEQHKHDKVIPGISNELWYRNKIAELTEMTLKF